MYNKNAINIFTMNICSIQKHFDELFIILDNIKKKLDIIILTEAWLGLEGISINNFQMNGYTVHAFERNKKQNDGVAIYITALEIVFKTSKIDFLIYPLYRSPNSNVDSALNELNDTILYKSTFITAKYKIILCDINIDLLKPSKIKEDYTLIMAQFGILSLIKNITRPTSKTCIDHIFLKTKSYNNLLSIVVHTNITDHYLTTLSIGNLSDNRNNSLNPLKVLKIDDFKLTNQIQNHNWSEICDFNDVNLALHYLVETINKLKKNSTTEISISSKTIKLKPWATTAIINSIRQRDR